MPDETLDNHGQEHSLSGTERTSGIPRRPAEYEAAAERWLARTVEFLMVVSDPLYAQLRPEQVAGLGETAARAGVGGDVMVKPVRTVVTGSVDAGSVIAGDLDELATAVADIAYQRLEQTMRAYFALVMDVTEQTRNVVDAHGDAAEGLLAMLEKMDVAFDADGNPSLQMVVSPSDAERVRRQLAEFTEDQQRRFAEIIVRKRGAYFVSRRRRRLPRHCH